MTIAPRYFVTGTDTEVGKTVATVQLIRLLNQQGIPTVGMKPAASGCELSNDILINEDVVAHQNATPIQAPLDLVSPYRFEPPISPHIAAREAGIEISIPHIHNCALQLAKFASTVVIEGAGGWFAPLSETQTIADLAITLQAPVILVVGMRLGCINHAMLTAHAIETAGLNLAGWIANQIDPKMTRYTENLHYLQSHLSAPCLAEVSYSHSALQSCLNKQALETLKLRNN